MSASMREQLDRPTMAALLRIVIQSFDSGGESMRSLRAQAVETVWHSMFDVDEPTFFQANADCDRDPWAFLQSARLKLLDESASAK